MSEKEVAYLIHRPFWRRGYATEAGRAARDYAFEVLGRQRVIALIRPENLPSIGVARKLGLTKSPSASSTADSSTSFFRSHKDKLPISPERGRLARHGRMRAGRPALRLGESP